MRYENITLAFVVAASLACSDSSDTPSGSTSPQNDATPSETSGTDAAAPSTAAVEQLALGQRTYGDHCASCHGANGEGDDEIPRLVGLAQGALPLDPPPNRRFRKSQFRTAADVADFVVKAMPPGAGGSLTDEQYWAVLAFALKANGIELQQPLDPTLAATLVIPR